MTQILADKYVKYIYVYIFFILLGPPGHPKQPLSSLMPRASSGTVSFISHSCFTFVLHRTTLRTPTPIPRVCAAAFPVSQSPQGFVPREPWQLIKIQLVLTSLSCLQQQVNGGRNWERFVYIDDGLNDLQILTWQHVLVENRILSKITNPDSLIVWQPNLDLWGI